MEVEIKKMSLKSSSEEFLRLEEMFVDFYSYMETKGLNLSISNNGQKLWIKALKSSLGKLSIIFIAVVNKKVIGFVAGNVRLSPTYLNSKRIGRVSQLYIEPTYRNRGIGVNLLQSVENWFEMKNTDFVELDVLPQNQKALNLWEKLGYKIDHIIMIKND